MRRLLLLSLLLLLGTGAVFGQGACTSSNLTCAGQWVPSTAPTPALRLAGAACSLGVLVGLSGAPDPGVSYSSDFGGLYNDFVTQPDGSLAWSTHQVPIQTLFASDSCYQACSSSIDLSSAGCPSLVGNVSPANAIWTKPDYALDGQASGGTPEFDSGTSLCSSGDVTVGIPPMSVVVHVTHCYPEIGGISYGVDTGAPNHCAFVYTQLTPPTCVCGYQATCSNNQYSCPNNNQVETYDYYYVYEICDPYNTQEECQCTYLIQDDYVCGSLVDTVGSLIEAQCLA